MTGKPHFDWRLLGLRAVAIAAGLAFFLAQSAVPVTAGGETRTLWLHHTHTGKDGKFTFKRDGQYDAGVLREMNIVLADWRTGTPTKMDPHLFDLLWEVYQDVGASQPYNIVSSYREPKTNAMLRAKSSGVAENSHTSWPFAMCSCAMATVSGQRRLWMRCSQMPSARASTSASV